LDFPIQVLRHTNVRGGGLERKNRKKKAENQIGPKRKTTPEKEQFRNDGKGD